MNKKLCCCVLLLILLLLENGPKGRTRTTKSPRTTASRASTVGKFVVVTPKGCPRISFEQLSPGQSQELSLRCAKACSDVRDNNDWIGCVENCMKECANDYNDCIDEKDRDGNSLVQMLMGYSSNFISLVNGSLWNSAVSRCSYLEEDRGNIQQGYSSYATIPSSVTTITTSKTKPTTSTRGKIVSSSTKREKTLGATFSPVPTAATKPMFRTSRPTTVITRNPLTPGECPPTMMYTSCAPKCLATCDDPLPLCSRGGCKRNTNCVCPPDKVQPDSRNMTCIPVSQCSDRHLSTYPPTETSAFYLLETSISDELEAAYGTSEGGVLTTAETIYEPTTPVLSTTSSSVDGRSHDTTSQIDSISSLETITFVEPQSSNRTSELESVPTSKEIVRTLTSTQVQNKETSEMNATPFTTLNITTNRGREQSGRTSSRRFSVPSTVPVMTTSRFAQMFGGDTSLTSVSVQVQTTNATPQITVMPISRSEVTTISAKASNVVSAKSILSTPVQTSSPVALQSDQETTEANLQDICRTSCASTGHCSKAKDITQLFEKKCSDWLGIYCYESQSTYFSCLAKYIRISSRICPPINSDDGKEVTKCESCVNACFAKNRVSDAKPTREVDSCKNICTEMHSCEQLTMQEKKRRLGKLPRNCRQCLSSKCGDADRYQSDCDYLKMIGECEDSCQDIYACNYCFSCGEKT